MMMSWADSSEREEVSELSPEIRYIDDRSLSLVESGGRGRRLSGGFIIKDLILLNINTILFYNCPLLIIQLSQARDLYYVLHL